MADLFLIPARGGSKGIPGKNIRPLNGKPLILYTIEAARGIANDEDICVSTDSEEIRAVCESYGLKVPFLRPAELATDTSGSREVILHALDFYEKQGKHYDRVVLLQPTSPFRTSNHIKEAMELWRPGIDMVVGVKQAATNPYYTAFEKDSEGYLHISKGHGLYTRRQDVPEVVEYNGAIYIISTDSIRKEALGSFAHRIPYEMSREASVDIDTPIDWIIAEAMLQNKL